MGARGIPAYRIQNLRDEDEDEDEEEVGEICSIAKPFLECLERQRGLPSTRAWVFYALVFGFLHLYWDSLSLSETEE